MYGTFMEGVPVQTWQPAGKTAIIIGSEAKGISEEVKALVDERISVERRGAEHATESLNAATAASICMYAYASSSPRTTPAV